ncbi:MAG: PAS domain S-box protein, partial [Gammaproteobacteria bacterium]
MRHLSVTRNAKGGSFRVLLIDETTADRALVEAAIGADVSIDAASGRDLTIGTAFAPEARPDIVLIGRRAREPTALIDELKTADPRLPVILLSGDRSSASAGELDAHAATDDPRAFAAAIASTLAGAARARAAEIEELRRREERARFVIMLTDSARGLESPDEIAELTMQQLRERLGADRCVYGNVDADGRSFTYAAVACAPGVKSIAGRFPISEHVRNVLLERGPFVVGDTELLAAADRAAFASIGARALLVAPLVKGGRLVALAGVHMLSPRSWRDEEIELVDVVAERLWEAMELARVSRALREREREYRDLFELSAVGVAQTDPASGRFVRANRRLCELTGYSEDELRRLSFNDITHPDDREANARAIEKVLRGEADRWSIEKRYVRRDGSIVWAQVSGQAMLDASGRPYRMIANAVDITDRRRAEALAIASRRQLQLITDSAPVSIMNCGTDYRLKFVNRTFADVYGKSPSEIVGQRVEDVLGHAAFEQIKPHADRALAGESNDFEAEVRAEGAGSRWIRCAYAPELDEFGRPVGWVAAMIDITDRKRAEQALREA